MDLNQFIDSNANQLKNPKQTNSTLQSITALGKRNNAHIQIMFTQIEEEEEIISVIRANVLLWHKKNIK